MPAPGLRVTTNLTVEAWIFPTGVGSDTTYGSVILNKEGEYEFGRAPDGTLRWAIAQSNYGPEIDTISISVSNSITVLSQLNLNDGVEIEGHGVTLGANGNDLFV